MLCRSTDTATDASRDCFAALNWRPESGRSIRLRRRQRLEATAGIEPADRALQSHPGGPKPRSATFPTCHGALGARRWRGLRTVFDLGRRAGRVAELISQVPSSHSGRLSRSPATALCLRRALQSQPAPTPRPAHRDRVSWAALAAAWGPVGRRRRSSGHRSDPSWWTGQSRAPVPVTPTSPARSAPSRRRRRAAGTTDSRAHQRTPPPTSAAHADQPTEQLGHLAATGRAVQCCNFVDRKS